MTKLIPTTQDEKQLAYYKYYETGLPEISAEKLALAQTPQPVGRGIPFEQKDDFILRPGHARDAGMVVRMAGCWS